MFVGFHPIIFSAVLDTPAISQHRFLLVLESEHLLPYSLSSTTTSASSGGTGGRGVNITNAITNIAPRFTVGSINGTRDPRTPVVSSSVNAVRAIGRNGDEKLFAHMVGGMSLLELSITNARTVLTIPKGWHLAHPFIYVVDCSTDDNGWQYFHHTHNSNNNRDGGKGPNSDSNDETTSSTQSRWLNRFDLTVAPSKSSSLDSKFHSKSGNGGHSNQIGTSCRLRRRLWMATIVPAEHLALTKRLLCENLKLSFSCRSDQTPLLQGDLMRYEKGTLTKSWQLRSVRLYANRLEFYSGSSKKGEVLLTDCEVKMLYRNQLPCPCPSLSSMYGAADQDNFVDSNHINSGASTEGGCYAFSIRNPLGSVGILLNAGSHEARVRWVLAIQYQLALHSPDLNFMPFEFAPPMPVSPLAAVLNSQRSTLPYYPRHRVLLYGTAVVQVLNAGVLYGGLGRGVDLWSNPQTLQLLPTELIFIDNRSDRISGRLPLEKMAISADEKGQNFTIKTAATGICLVIDTDPGHDSTSADDGSRIHVRRPNFIRNKDEDQKGIPQSNNSIWLLAIRRQISFIDNQKLKMKTSPKEEQLPQANISFRDRLQLYYADSDIANHGQYSADELRWTAPPVEGLSDEYLHQLHFPHKPIPLSLSSSPSSGAPSNPSSSSPDDDALEQSLEFVNEKLLLGIELALAPESRPGTYSSTTSSAPSLNKIGDEDESVHTITTKISDDHEQIKNITHALDTRPANEVKSNSTSAESSTTLVVPHSTVAFYISGGNSVSSGSSGSGGQVSIPTLPSQPSRRGPSSTASTATSSAKRSLINPKFILTVLKGITHRFVLVLECEHRRTAVGLLCPPRFTVGGPKACKDPRITPLVQLLGISNRSPEIQLPSGWLMLHQYIYIIQPNTDENGWQYRSSWSDGIVTSRDEQWVESAPENANLQVRRRLWMTTVVRKDEFLRAKKAVMDNLTGARGDIILQGVLFKYQPDTAASSGSAVGSSSDNSNMSSSINWQKRKVLLFHNKLELFIGNDKKGEASLLECEVKMLFNSECPGRKFAFAVRNPSGSVSLVFDAESKESRLRWVVALQYQLAVIYPDINFSPFEYGPPTGSHPDDRVLLCGDLLKGGGGGGGGGGSVKWVKMHFQLRPYELLYYEISAPGSGSGSGTTLKGRLRLEHAVIRTPREKERDGRARDGRDDGNYEFQLRSASGMTLMLKAEKESDKVAWIRALKRHVQYIENEKLRLSTTPAEELPDEQGRRGELTEAQRIAQYFDNDIWTADQPARDGEGPGVGNISSRTLQLLEDDLAFLQSRKKQMSSRSEIWDSNPLEIDVGGEAEQQQRIYNRRPAQPSAASPTKSIQKVVSSSASASRQGTATSVSFAVTDAGVAESVDKRGTLTLQSRAPKSEIEEEDDFDWEPSPQHGVKPSIK